MRPSFKIFRYSLPLIKPLVFKTEKIVNREGLILILKYNDKIEGIGEIAPLPGFSKSKIEDCINDLKEVLSRLITKPVENLQWLDTLEMIPEVRFGVEMAVYNELANRRDLSLNRFFSNSARDEVIINGLLQGKGDSAADEINQLLDKGFKSIKVKISGNVKDDIDYVTDILKIAANRAQIHIDANQKWSFENAVLFGKKMGPSKIAYIEEPFSEISGVPEFFKKTGIPVALDESLNLFEFNFITSLNGVKFLVFKPTVLGGIRKVLKLIQDAKNSGLKPVISSSFESGVALLSLAHIAAAGGEDITAGLDTLKFFSRDLLKNPLNFNDGKIIFTRNIQERDICFDDLKEIKLL